MPLGVGKETHQDTDKLPHKFGEDRRNSCQNTQSDMHLFTFTDIQNVLLFFPLEVHLITINFWKSIAGHFQSSSDILQSYQLTQCFQTAVSLGQTCFITFFLSFCCKTSINTCDITLSSLHHQRTQLREGFINTFKWLDFNRRILSIPIETNRIQGQSALFKFGSAQLDFVRHYN